MVRRLRLAVALALGTVSVTAYALGLGDIKTHSALNQNFSADIPLVSVGADNLEDLRVKLASPEAFESAGVQRPYFLSLLKFKAKMSKNGKAFIHVSSDFPIREPFLDFLIQANWPRGHLVREYTVLLDPPTFTKRAAPRIAPVQAGRSAPAAAPVPARSASAPAATSANQYGPIQPNETLWSVARKVRPEGVSMAQMVIALQQANPNAFIGGNVNRLRKGVILRVPDRQAVLGISRVQALAEYRKQQQAWVAEKQSAGQTGSAAAAAPETKGELHIASARPKGKGEAGAGEDKGKHVATLEEARQQLMLERENVATSRMVTQELRGQMDDMKKRLADMQRLVSLKDQQLAQLQEEVAARKGAAAGTAQAQSTVQPAVQAEKAGLAQPSVSTAAVTSAAAGQVPAGSSAAESRTAAMAGGVSPSTVAAAPIAGAAMVKPESAAGTRVKAGNSTTATGAAGTGVASSQEQPPASAAAGSATASKAPSGGESAPAQGAPKAENKPAASSKPPAAAPSPARPQAGFLAEYWPYLAGAGGLVLLLLALLSARRKEATDDLDVPDQPLPPTAAADLPDVDAESELGDLAGGDTSFLSEFSPSDIKSLRDETTEVDPVSEADIYIAYGRYQQAAELLEQAQEREPNRLAVKHKLLEVYYAMGNRDGFVNLAQQIVDGGQDVADAKAWVRAREMGRELAPDNALFAGGDDTETAQGLDSLNLSDIHTETPTELKSEGEDLSKLSTDLVDRPVAGDGVAGQADGDLTAQELALDLDDLDEYSEPIEEVESLELELPDLDSEELISIMDPAESTASPSIESLQASEPASSGAGHAEDSALSPDDLAAELEALSDLSMLGAEDEDHKTASKSDSPLTESESLPDANSQTRAGGGGVSLDEPLELDVAFDHDLGEDDAPDSVELTELMEDDGEVDGEAAGTKLELARAYMEMGDPEGARSILEEVKHEGTAGQKDEAATLLSQLG